MGLELGPIHAGATSLDAAEAGDARCNLCQLYENKPAQMASDDIDDAVFAAASIST
jgi:hypothetical protein